MKNNIKYIIQCLRNETKITFVQTHNKERGCMQVQTEVAI